MARITIEDCLERIDNHFKLVLVAGHRARQLQAGVAPKIETSVEKNSIIALREIAEGLVDEDVLDEPLVQDATAEDELAELIAKGLMDHEAETKFNDMKEDAGEDDIEMDTLETGPQTIDDMEKIADLNIDHLMTGERDIGETTTALSKEMSESELAFGEKLLSKTGAMPRAVPPVDAEAAPETTEETTDVAAVAGETDSEQAQEQSGEGESDEDKSGEGKSG